MQRSTPPAEQARELGIAPAVLEARLEAARQRLLTLRQGRPPVHRDEKILTAWNALAIKGMARAARVLGRPDYLVSAEAALGFIRASLWRGGRLLASYNLYAEAIQPAIHPLYGLVVALTTPIIARLALRLQWGDLRWLSGAVWLNRHAAVWPDELPPPDHEIPDLRPLAGLLAG